MGKNNCVTYHIISDHIISHHITSYHITSYHIIDKPPPPLKAGPQFKFYLLHLSNVFAIFVQHDANQAAGALVPKCKLQVTSPSFVTHNQDVAQLVSRKSFSHVVGVLVLTSVLLQVSRFCFGRCAHLSYDKEGNKTNHNLPNKS